MDNLRVETKAAIEALIAIFDATSEGRRESLNVYGIEFDPVKFFFTSFLCYLSIVDGTVSWDECEVIEYYLDISFAPEELASFVGSFGIATKFPSKVPNILDRFIEADNELYEAGEKVDTYSSELLSTVCKMLAIDLITSDGEAENIESSKSHEYLTMIDTYIYEHLAARKFFK